MKLNLLPTHVSKASAARTATILSGLMAAAMVAAAVWMSASSKKELDDLKGKAEELVPQAQAAATESKKADAIIQQAKGIILNQKLSEAMMAHNSANPDLYDEVRKYIPSYFRVTSMSAVPAGEVTTLNLTGVIQTYQQYADLMLALLRIPGATGVARQGWQHNDTFVPPLSADNQSSRPVAIGDAPIPDDPQARLDYYISRGSITGFDGVGGFGEGDMPRNRGAMPKWSEIQVTVALQRNVQTPDPRASLAAGAAGGPQPPAPAGAAAPGGNKPATNAPGGGNRRGPGGNEDI